MKILYLFMEAHLKVCICNKIHTSMHRSNPCNGAGEGVNFCAHNLYKSSITDILVQAYTYSQPVRSLSRRQFPSAFDLIWRGRLFEVFPVNQPIKEQI